MEKIFDPVPLSWNKEINPEELADYEAACQSEAMHIMHKNLMEQIEYFRQKNNDINVIDGGCGYSRWGIYLNKNGIKCVGVDQNERVISQVKKFDPSLPLRVADIRNLPLADESFDLFYSFGVLEHLEEGMDKALAEVWRILRPKGRLLITVPGINWIKKLTSPVRILRRKLAPERYKYFNSYRYTKQELLRILSKNNFKLIRYGVSDKSGMGLWEDFEFLRKPGIFRLNSAGAFICRIFNLISPWITNWGILVIGEKDENRY